MKTLFAFFAVCLCLLFVNKTSDHERSQITVVQINAKWNDNNTRKDLEYLEGCDYKFGWLEDQPQSVQDNVRTVPIVVIYNGETPAHQYAADISLSLTTPLEEIQQRIFEIR